MQQNGLQPQKPHRRRSDDPYRKVVKAVIPVVTAALGWLASYLQQRGH